VASGKSPETPSAARSAGILVSGSGNIAVAAFGVRDSPNTLPLGHLDGLTAGKIAHGKDLAVTPNLKRAHPFLVPLDTVKTNRVDNLISVA